MPAENEALSPSNRSVRFLSDQEVENQSPPLWLIHHLLPSDTTARLTGDSELISHLAVDWALRVGTGLKWHDNNASSQNVAYITGPDFEHIGSRIKSWKLEHKWIGTTKVRVSSDLLNLLPQSESSSLSDEQSKQADLKAAFLVDFPDAPPSFVIIDPLRLPNYSSIEYKYWPILATYIRKEIHAHVLLLQGTNSAQLADDDLVSFEMHFDLSPVEPNVYVQHDLYLKIVQKKYPVPNNSFHLKKSQDLGL